MIKSILPAYLICFALYVFFSRQPDYMDSEFAPATIHFVADSTGKTVAKAIFTVDGKKYAADAYYPLRQLTENRRVTVIYDNSNPVNAAVYIWWGYWLCWNELLASILIPAILWYAATAITGNPTPEALIEELEMTKKNRKSKYDI